MPENKIFSGASARQTAPSPKVRGVKYLFLVAVFGFGRQGIMYSFCNAKTARTERCAPPAQN
jgi:hypothetical protein